MNIKHKYYLRPLAVLGCCLATALPARAQNIVVKNGEKIAFLGDSITQQGANNPVGYVRLVISGLKVNGVEATPIPAGISGHKSNQMLERLDKDVIARSPNWMTLSCGVNDVWHGERGMGVPLEQYKTNIGQILDKAKAANINVIVLTATPIMEDANNDLNKKLAPYNDFLRAIAKERGLLLADLNADFWAARAASGETNPKKNVLTNDGVHMSHGGNQVMAKGVLRTLGLSEEQLNKAREAWLDTPGGSTVNFGKPLTLRQYEQLEKVAKARNTTVNAMVAEQLEKFIQQTLAEAAKN